MNLIEGLTNFNLTKQEATLYVLLLKSGQMTGYEAAKHTGISRSNTYTALAGLVDKGAAYVLEEGKVTRYTPVPAAEFCSNKISCLEEIKKDILQQLPVLNNDPEGYITIKGAQEIINKMRNTVRQAQAKLMAAGFKLTENRMVSGEKDWVYGVIYQGHQLQIGDKAPIGATLTLMVGDGVQSAGADSVDMVEDAAISADDSGTEDDSWF